MLISGFGEEARSPRRERLAHKDLLSPMLRVCQDRDTVCPGRRHIKKVYNVESEPTTQTPMKRWTGGSQELPVVYLLRNKESNKTGGQNFRKTSM